jgi:hypothetical protein
MSRIRNAFSFLFVIAPTLGGCGLFVPEMEEFYQPQSYQKAFENIIVNNVKCELHKGIQDTMAMLKSTGRYPGNDIDWLLQQGALVSLKLTVDEKSALSPGVTLNKVLPNAVTTFPVGGNVTTGQSFSLGLGASSSLDATRIETVAFTYSFADLMAEKPIENPCENEDGVLIQSNLKIGQFILNKMFLAKVPGSVVIKKASKKGIKSVALASPFSTFSYQVTFVATYGANATPTWKFLQVSVNPTSPLVNASRMRTHDLTITIGATKRATETSPALISSEASEVHFAHLIGQAVATSIESQQH